MRALVDHGVLAVSAALLLVAGDRVAAALGARGIPRIVGAATAATAYVVVAQLVTGLLSWAPLTATAVVAWLLALKLPHVPTGLPAWWRARSLREQVALGAGAFLLVGWSAWQLRHPYLGVDGVTYHLGLSGAWAQDGQPGGIVGVIDGIPIANYPVTNEVVLSWAIGIAGAWTPASLWTPVIVVLLLLAGWSVLRALRVPPLVAGLGLAAFTLQPLVLTQTGTPLTDVAATAWLAVTAALVLASRTEPRLLALALVSAGLSFGTKTTPTMLLAVLLGLGLFWQRRALRPLVGHLAGGAVVAVLAGGIWALRNLIDHGSPAWPFVAGPGGDPVPAAFAPYDQPFLQHPGEMLEGRTFEYLNLLSGGTLLLLGALLLWVVPRTRASMALAGLALAAMLVWANAPYTGITKNTALAVGAVRYLLPAMAVATVAVCVAARDHRTARAVALGLFGLSALVSAGRTWQLGFPFVPALSTVLGLLVAGAVVTWVALRLPPRAVAAAGAAGALLLVVGAAGSVDGYVARHAESGVGDGGIAAAVEARAEDGDEVVMSPATVAILRGDRLERTVTLVAPECAALRGLVVLQKAPPTPEYRKARRCFSERRPAYADGTYELFDAR